MEAKKIIFSLLYQALLDIRYSAHEKQSYSGIFKLADLFHNIPLKLNGIADGEGTYDELLEEILYIAKIKGYDSWLKNAMDQIS